MIAVAALGLGVSPADARKYRAGPYVLVAKGERFKSLTITDSATGESAGLVRKHPVQSVVMDKRGRVAWIERSGQRSKLVVRDARRRIRTIVSGRTEIRGLKLSRGVLRWTTAGRRRSRRIPDVQCQLPGNVDLGRRVLHESPEFIVAATLTKDLQDDASGGLYLCVRSDGRPRRLRELGAGFGWVADVGALLVSGDFLAYVEQGYDKNSGSTQSVVRVNWRTFEIDDGPSDGLTWENIELLALDNAGRFVFVGTRDPWDSGRSRLSELVAGSSYKFAIATVIDVRFARAGIADVVLANGVVSWTSAGQSRSQQLP